jgi:hypothetical protein
MYCSTVAMAPGLTARTCPTVELAVKAMMLPPYFSLFSSDY